MKIFKLNNKGLIKLEFKKNVELIMRESKIEYKFKRKSNDFLNSIVITVELCLPSHASYYALLGAEFIPNNTNELYIVVMQENNNEREYIENITNALHYKDIVRVGLTNLYAKSILNEAIDFFTKTNKIPSGSIIFNMAANSLIGSSERIFSTVTKIILNLMLEQDQLHSDEFTKDVCNKYQNQT